jgi:hypothetical protein
MNRICISNFGRFPLIAQTFWKIPKYLTGYPKVESFNKMVTINNFNFNSFCFFSHQCDEVDKNVIIKSQLNFLSNDHKLEEICEYIHFENHKKLIIKYNFDDLHNIELNINRNIENLNFYKCLTSGSQEILKIINHQIQENKNNYTIN